MSDLNFESIIRQYVTLPAHPSPTGWHTVKCAVCNDHSARGGFRFDGTMVSYNCFNCSHTAGYDETTYSTIPPNMVTILDAYSIPPSEYNHLRLAGLSHRKKGVVKQEPVDPVTELIALPLPEFFMPLSESDHIWAEVAREYLRTDRSIDSNTYPFLILKDEAQSEAVELAWRGRLIIPFYRNNTLVWYQGRDLRPSSRLRYLNPSVVSQCILSDYEVLRTNLDKPLYVCEGFFDAFVIDGVAIFGNKIKPGQLKLIDRSPRKKVYIPDTEGDGHISALQAIELGWGISIPNFGEAKDINKAVLTYGSLYVKHNIKESTCHGLKAELNIALLCKRSKKRT